MFSRIRPLLRVSVFQNVLRGCQSQSPLESFLKNVNESPPKQGYSLLFFDDEVQQLLKKLSNIDLKKVFRPRPLGKELTTPVYKLMTTEELEKEMKKAYKNAESLLQIPPLVNISEDKTEILDPDTSLDGYDEHYCKHVFIDISYNKTNENRAVVVREPNGILRTADRSERFRMNQIYNPTPGREIETPEMFSFEHLQKVITRKDYEFILDRACAQFEPDEPKYHEVITLTYEAINYCNDFPMLYSTRHFGSLVFYLITHKKIDSLLNYNILNNRIDDAVTLVKLYHKIHPQSKSAQSSKGKTDDMEILNDFIKLDSNEENTLSRSLEIYKRKEQSQRELSQGIREAHGETVRGDGLKESLTLFGEIKGSCLTKISTTRHRLQTEQTRNPRLGSEKQKKKPRRVLSSAGLRSVGKLTSGGNSLPVDIQNFLKNQSAVPGDSNRNEEERLKIAFAEGYLTGSKHLSTPQTPRWMRILQPVLTSLIVIGLCLAFLATTNGSIFRMQTGKQIEIDPVEISVTFEDVKGVDEAKQELKEVVEFLKNPEKFSILGGKLPKGVLLVGPPGTGKTLLARAVAGEAKVPFFHAAGPEFDEVLVGQGARRVRDLFKAAKEAAPCVIFIDEIDSVGSKRTNSLLHPYANQTINQLLSEMDGFHQNEGVIVLGATNRREDLDKALLRPGRFDVEVVVPTPDYAGRKQIFELYLNKILCRDVDVDILARGTVGFTGADIENMVNQAALKAAVEGADCVTMTYLENARDKVLMGPEKKTRIPDEEANLITAYHEGGHTIVGYYTKDAHPLHKVTIMPRGPSLGHTAYIPEKDRYLVTKSQLLAVMDTMMGGRAAEELIFGPDKITSGSSNDLRQATLIATHMVKEWGMSEKIGLRTLENNEKSLITVNEFGKTMHEAIDSEIKRLLQESYERAKNILRAHAREHKLLAEALMKYETLDAADIKAILRQGDEDPGTVFGPNPDEW